MPEAVAPVDCPASPEPGDNAAPTVKTVSSVEEFAALVVDATRDGKRHWFRGTRDSTHRLVPSLYRHPQIQNPDDLIRLEWELLSEFRHQAPPFANNLPSAHLELLFLMQHHGIPTRLLDWTENPFIALFFALENARQEQDQDAKEAAVWLLNPIKLNTIANSNRENTNRIFGAYADELGAYQPSQEAIKVSMLKPLAIYGVHNSQRIVAQRGSFTIFGKDIMPLDKQPDLGGPNGVVEQVRIDAKAKKEMLKDLYNIGVADSVVYPDLDGLGREIRNRRGF